MVMQNISSLGSLIFVLTIVTNIVIAAFVYADNTKHATNKLFFALSAAVSLWLCTMLATSIVVHGPWYLVLAKLTLIFATPMNVLFLLFARTVPDNKFGYSHKQLLVLLAAAATVVAISASPYTFTGVAFTENGPEPVPGPGLPVFGLFQTALNISVIFTLFMKARMATGERSVQLRLILLGILLMLGMITGTIFVPVLLLGDPSFVPFAPLYVLFFTGLSAYVIFKRKLLNVKVIAAELFSAMLVLINSAQLFLADSPTDFILRLVTFIFVGVFAVFLVQSVLREVRRSEEVHQMSSMLATANEELKQMDQLKSEFISIASHQLRTPISVIKGYLSLILEGAYGNVVGPLRDKLEQMYSMNERLVQMVNNMLNVTRIEKNKLEYVCAMYDVRTVIDQAVEEMGIKARQKRVSIVFADRPDAPVGAYVDQEKFHEVITNLVDNAIKYSEGGVIEIRLKPAPKRRGVIITVKDEGIGMTQDEANQVFQKFYRAREPSVLRESGTGLGLYICAMFTRSMGGDVWIEKTSPGKGTTVALIVPTRPDAECIPKSGRG
jgi:signal transduction histidine kinase